MMKNLALFLLFVATAASTNAQTTTPSVTPAGEGKLITRFDVTYANRLFETDIWKAERFDVGEKNVETMGILGDCSPEVVENPDKTGINKNAKCLKLTVGTGGDVSSDYDIFKMYLPWNDSANKRFNLYGRRRISLLYKPGDGSTDFNVNLELCRTKGDDDTKKYDLKLGAWYDAGGGWKRMYFNFEPYEKASEANPEYKDIDDIPDMLVFDAKTRTGENYDPVSYKKYDVFYIDDIKVEDEPYADGIWIDSFGNKHDRWVTEYNASTAHQEFPHEGNHGVVYLSGTWLKGQNIVNPDILEKAVEGKKVGRWVFDYNEFRDLSWHVKPGEVKYYVFQCDDSDNKKISKLRMPDRGAMVGTTTAAEREKYSSYGERFIDNKNVLVFAESCGGYEDNWYDTNVVYYKGSNTWEAKDLEMTDAYEFVNPIVFTSKKKVKVTRHMDNGFNTVVYPFSLSASDICSSRVGIFYHHNDESTVYFIPTRETQANVPFVTEGFTSTLEGDINVTDHFQQFVGERTISVVDPNRTYEATEPAPEYIPSQDNAGYKFVGTYKRISGEGKWGIATVDGKQSLKKGLANSAFKPFRAYLDLNGSQAPARYSTLSISDYEDLNPTDIDAVEIPVDAQSGTADVYSLSGVRIASAATPAAICQLPQGVYIVNGKKMFIK